MTSFRRAPHLFALGFFVVWLSVSCSSDFNKSPMDSETSTFSLEQVQQSRSENLKIDGLGLPGEIMVEFSSRVIDTAMERPIVNEAFHINMGNKTYKVISDPTGRIVWSQVFKVDPGQREQEFKMKTTVSASGIHRGRIPFTLRVRPWHPARSQVIDSRYQNDSKLRKSDKLKDSSIDMIIDEANIRYSGASHHIDQNLNLQVHKNYQVTLNPQILRQATAHQIAEPLALTEGKFTVNTYIFDTVGPLPSPQSISQQLALCLPHCLKAVDQSESTVINNKIGFNLKVKIPFQQLAQFRFRSLMVFWVKSSHPYLRDVVSYGIWSPTKEGYKLDLIEAQLGETTRLLKKIPKNITTLPVPSLDFKQAIAKMTSIYPSQKFSREFLALWNLDAKKLNIALESRQKYLTRKVKFECPKSITKGLKPKTIVKLISDGFNGLVRKFFDGKKSQKLICEERIGTQKLKINHLSVIRSVQRYEVVPKLDSEYRIQLMDTVFREVRHNKASSQSSSKFAKAYLESKGETPWPVVKVSGVGQWGREWSWSESQSLEENQRSRNAAIRLKEILVQNLQFRINASAIRCLTVYDPIRKQRHLHCNSKKTYTEDFFESWYYMYGYFKSLDHVFLTDSQDKGLNQFTFGFRGDAHFRRLSHRLENMTNNFNLVPDYTQPVWTNFSDTLKEKVDSELKFSPPPIIEHL